MKQEERQTLQRIRLVAVDLDGTLLRSSGSPSRHTRKVVKRAPEYGVTVTIATGRSSYAAERMSRIVGARGPRIAANGAQVLSPTGEEWQFIPIDPASLVALTSVLRRIGAVFESSIRGAVVVERQFASRRLRAKNIFSRVNSPTRMLPEGGTDDFAGQVLKVYMGARPGQAKEVMEAIDQDFRGILRYMLTRTHQGDAHLEIQDLSVNKGQALILAGEKMELSAEEIAAIGDGNNDIEMVQTAGLGVGMANAAPGLANVADRFTLSCDDDGVAQFLEEIYRAKAGA